MILVEWEYIPNSKDGRVVKAAGLRSAHASVVGSTPTLCIFFFVTCYYHKKKYYKKCMRNYESLPTKNKNI